MFAVCQTYNVRLKMRLYTSLDEQSYRGEFKEVLGHKNLPARSALNLLLPLRSHLPIGSDYKISFVVEPKRLVTIVFHHETKGEFIQSTLEAIVFTDDAIENLRDASNPLTRELIEIGINAYNRIANALTVHRKESDFPILNLESLSSVTHFRTIALEPWEEVTGHFVRPDAIPTNHKECDQEEVDEITRICGLSVSGKNPFLVCEEITARAFRELDSGNYDFAVICSQLAIETFLWELLSLIRGAGKEELFQEYEAKGFLKMVKSSFCDVLKGNWDPSAETTEIGKWYTDSYRLRNLVVHAGLKPTFEEGEKAIEAMIEFRGYIVGLIERQPKKLAHLQGFFHRI